MTSLLHLLSSMLLALLPSRYRRRIGYAIGVNPLRGAVVGGALQLGLCLATFCLGYLYFLDERVGKFAQQLIAKNAESAMGSLGVQFGAGAVSLMEYLIRPTSVVLVYFAVEGLVRLSAAVVSDEIVPTLPLQLIAWTHGWGEKKRYERELGPPVEDLVQRGSGDFALTIASCRPKPWTLLTTIAYEDVLYELVREQTAQPPRRWVYVLRKRPEGKIVRGAIQHYDPEEPLPTRKEAAAARD